MNRIFACFTLLLLVPGCVQPTPDASEQSETTIVMPDTECLGTFFGRTPDFSELDPWLPPGFKGADASTIIRQFGFEVGLTGRAFMAVMGVQCERELSWLGFWILVEEPRVDGVSSRGPDALHWFEVAQFLENFPHTPNLTARGANIASMSADMDVAPVGPVLARAFLAEQGEMQLIEMIHFGSANILNLDNPMSSWQVTDGGTHEFRANITATGLSGFGSCSAETPWVRDFTAGCADGQALTGTIEAWRMNGTYLFHEGVHPR